MARFHWGWRIGLVYAAFALSTLGFVAFAMTQRVDLVRDDYYQESLRTTAAQAALQRGRASGVTLLVEDGNLRVAMPHASSGKVHIHLYRPDNPARDQHLTAEIQPDGTVSLPLSRDMLGKWRAIIGWTRNGEAMTYEQSVMLP
jgi:hypothetical protein